jgi:outer membrane receptor protein involved in Fe transport
LIGLLLTLVLWPGLPGPAFAQAGAEPQTRPDDQKETKPVTTFQVEVIGTTPLPGVDLLIEEIPAPVHTLLGRDIEQAGTIDLSDFLNRRISGVHVNEVQGNPLQPDVSYRGYTASPLLGTPQGLSVYLDGMRLNQPFGEAVSWDLIPRMAIASGALMPGSNPLFGLNTLGGALSIQTKDGRSNQGTHIQAIYGSHTRRAVEFEHGGARATGLNWYVTANLFGESGWRDDSPSDVRQLFGKLGWDRGKTTLRLTTAYANNSLTGNGLQEQRFLDRDYGSVYTKPDVTENASTVVNLTARHGAGARLAVSWNAYYRHIRTDTLNGDINDGSLDQSVYQPNAAEQAALAAAGYIGVPASGATAANTPFPSWRCIANALLGDEPATKCNGLINRTGTVQDNGGASGQLTWLGSPDTINRQFTAGAAYDGSRVGFQQSTELGYLNPDRSVTGVSAFGDGVTGGSVDGEPYDTRVDLNGRIHTWSVYATDTLSLGELWHVTMSGRFNRTSISHVDLIQPGGSRGSLDGTHRFSRFNPAAGVTVGPLRAVNVYVGYSEGSRAPASVELGCADPGEPCKLPNAMAGDPPLDQVVTRTFEWGLRNGRGRRVSWNVGLFRADNRNDILFVAATQTGFGYFKNFGNTRRQGMELAASRNLANVTIGAGYTYLDATYQSGETVDGSSNSTNSAAANGVKGLEGTIRIEPGDRIPMIPRHTLKVYADFRATEALAFDINLLAISSSYARGNENNQHEPDGVYYLGPGTSPGYAVMNLGARYQVTRRFQLLGQVNNLFNRRYYTAAQLGQAGFTDAGTFIARPFPAVGGDFPIGHATFYAPGAPLSAWFGTRINF